MSYNNQIYARIREEYRTKYRRAEEAAELRRAEVWAKVPEVAEIDRVLRQTGASCMQVAMSGGDVETEIAEVRRINADLRATRAALMEAAGFPADYTVPRYECEACHDSGFILERMCSCMRRDLINAAYDASGVGSMLREQTFDAFDLSYYEHDPVAHKRMTQIYHKMHQYADAFNPATSGSLVLFGDTGLGKTHLSSAVARAVIDKGYDVYYVTAVGLLAEFEARRFGSASIGDADNDDPTRCYATDLLIIDDLGTEVNNQFTSSVLYDLINTRLIRRRPTIISTNLAQDEFRRRYYDRITSRVLGEYTVLPFMGKDIRALKLQRK